MLFKLMVEWLESVQLYLFQCHFFSGMLCVVGASGLPIALGISSMVGSDGLHILLC